MVMLQGGVIRLAVLATVGGAKARTLYLPPCVKDGLELNFIKKSSSADLIDGSPRTRLLGYVPELTCSWSSGYDEGADNGYAIGTADGQRPSLEDLLVILSLPTGMLRVSPGPASGGFTVDSVTVKPIGRKGLVYTGLQVVFQGRDVLPSMTWTKPLRGRGDQRPSSLIVQ